MMYGKFVVRTYLLQRNPRLHDQFKKKRFFNGCSTNGMEESKNFSFNKFYQMYFEKLPVQVSLSVKRPNLSEIDEHPWISTHDVFAFHIWQKVLKVEL